MFKHQDIQLKRNNGVGEESGQPLSSSGVPPCVEYLPHFSKFSLQFQASSLFISCVLHRLLFVLPCLLFVLPCLLFVLPCLFFVLPCLLFILLCLFCLTF